MAQYESTSVNSGYIGIIRNYAAIAYLETNTMDNSPSYLRSRPSSNQVNVKIIQNIITFYSD